MEPVLSDLEKLARQAGDILREGFIARPGFGTGHQVNYKSEIDPVTEVDFRSEDFLLSEIRKRFPEDTIVTEESGTHTGNGRGQWYIDPLDGTVNFAHGIPVFCVSIAYGKDGAVHLGVVYDPLRDECFSAEQGKGAWLNGEPIRTAANTDLNKSLLATGFPYDVRTNPINLDVFTLFSKMTQGVRRLGSAALDLCYVGAGRFNGYWELGVFPWDVAAAGLVATEAGAKVTDVYGNNDYLAWPPSIIAANSELHAQILKILEQMLDGKAGQAK